MYKSINIAIALFLGALLLTGCIKLIDTSINSNTTLKLLNEQELKNTSPNLTQVSQDKTPSGTCLQNSPTCSFSDFNSTNPSTAQCSSIGETCSINNQCCSNKCNTTTSLCISNSTSRGGGGGGGGGGASTGGSGNSGGSGGSGNSNNNSSNNSVQVDPNALTVCNASQTTFFTTHLVPLVDFLHIVPLGSTNPVDHVFPVNHLYYYSTPSNASPMQLPIYAPSTIHVTRIQIENVTPSGGGTTTTDYTVYLNPCTQINITLGHVGNLTGSTAGNYSAPYDSCSSETVGSNDYYRCSKVVSINLTEGELIGYSRTTSALDVGLEDYRQTSLSFVNQNRWLNSTLHSFCPADYYNSTMKSEMLSKFGSYNGDANRTVEPICGEIMQDVANTSQGNWILSNATDTYPEAQHLALIWDAQQALKQMFSIGNTMMTKGLNYGIYQFFPQNSGTTNRNFSQVTNDGNVYCYETATQYSNTTLPGVIIINMTDNNTLQIENLTASNCASATKVFSANATTFIR